MGDCFANWLPSWFRNRGSAESSNLWMRTLPHHVENDQSRKLNRLEHLHPSLQRDCVVFNREVAKLLRSDPGIARRPHSFVPFYKEYLLFRLLCYKPTLEVVKQVYLAYPAALRESNNHHRSPLHRACQFQASTDVVQFFLEMQPRAVEIVPSPLFLAIHPETPKGVIELLIKAYPPALVQSYDGWYSALDQAFNEGLATSVITTMIKYYPLATLKVKMMPGAPMIRDEVAVIMTSDHPKVKVLNVALMKLSPAGFECAWTTLATNTTVVEFILDVSSITTAPSRLSDSMENMLATNTHMKKLAFRNGMKSHALGTALIEGLNKNNVLQELTLDGGLELQNVRALIDVVAQRLNISTLRLRDTSIDYPTALASLVHLRHLDLSNCDVGPSIAEPLARLLQATTKLRVLRVAYNRISAEGSVILANAFTDNSSVIQIDYRGNKLGQKGLSVLVQVLRDFNLTIEEFRLNPDDETVYEDYYCSLNRAGRKKASDATIEEFVNLLIASPSFDMQHGLLRHVPHVWCTRNVFN
jgi:Leucine-rich repeat (LRR) protein